VQVQTWCVQEQNVCSFSNIASKSFAAVRKAFNNAYPDKEVPNKTTVHEPVTKFRDTGSVCLWEVLIDPRNSWNYGCTYFKQCISCNNGIRPQEFNIAVGLCVKVFMCRSWGCFLNGTSCTTLVLLWGDVAVQCCLSFLISVATFSLSARNKRTWKLKNPAFVFCVKPARNVLVSSCQNDCLEHWTLVAYVYEM
jgi:hypothetical protein